jgi:hypothetical protein
MVGVFVGFSGIFLLGTLIFKGLTARRLYKSFGVNGLRSNVPWDVTPCCFAYTYRHFERNWRLFMTECCYIVSSLVYERYENERKRKNS